MANRTQFKLSVAQRRRRNFSESFKRQKVQELDSGQLTLNALLKEYELSYTTIYRWQEIYGGMKKKPSRLIVESQSDTHQLIELRKKVAELERLVGQKQILLDFKEKMIDLAEQTYGVDIKKKFSTPPSGITGNTGKSSSSP
jgi:transposase